MRKARRLFDHLLVPLLAVALALLGTVRLAPSLAAAAIDLSAYVMPDGSVPYICGLTDDGQPGHHAQGAHCPACVVTKAFLDVPTLGLPPRPLMPMAVIAACPSSLVFIEAHPRAPPARGPPSFLVT